jgi:uncharacterized protein DUF4232
MIAPPKPPAHDELELLIKEARKRQLRRRLLGAAGIAIAAALGLAVYAALAGNTEDAGTTPGGVAQAVAAPCSAAAGWSVRVDGLWSEPTGQHTAPLEVTRIGTRSCTLQGYPRVVLLSAGGRTLDFAYSHRGDFVVAARPPHAVDVGGGGGSAFFVLNKYRCDIRARAVARWLRVGLPGVHGTLTVRLPHYVLDYCPAEAPSRTIAVSPIVARFAQAAAEPQ